MESLGQKRAEIAKREIRPFNALLVEVSREILKVPRYNAFTGERLVSEEDEIIFLQSLATTLGIEVDITRKVVEEPIIE